MTFRTDHEEAPISMLHEALFGIEVALLRATPVYYGLGVSHGDGSAAIVIPGFLGTDLYLVEMFAWLRRVGYRPYFSGIGLNAECPNLLIRSRLNETVDRALRETRRPVHLIGHSLGGIIARSLAGQRPEDVASVVTLGSPFRGTVVHARVLRAAEMVRDLIRAEHGGDVLPHCYTGRCTCDFLDSLRRDLPASMDQTAIYTRKDGVVDWKYCITGDDDVDVEVSGTHIGLVFNAAVYGVVAERLAATVSRRRESSVRVRGPALPILKPAATRPKPEAR